MRILSLPSVSFSLPSLLFLNCSAPKLSDGTKQGGCFCQVRDTWWPRVQCWRPHGLMEVSAEEGSTAQRISWAVGCRGGPTSVIKPSWDDKVMPVWEDPGWEVREWKVRVAAVGERLYAGEWNNNGSQLLPGRKGNFIYGAEEYGVSIVLD